MTYAINSYENVDEIINVEQSAVRKLSKDLKEATRTMSRDEARFLVDRYYVMQNDRIHDKNRLRAFSENDEPHETIVWLSDNSAFLEKEIAKALQVFADSSIVGRWSMSQMGIGGVISAGLIAHINIKKVGSVGQILSFAGMLPNPKEWKKGELRPHNAKLKTLFWKVGESFVKVSGKENAFYGKVYKQWKEKYTELNENLAFAETSKNILDTKKFSKTTEAFGHYSEGKLPPAHIHARAKRKAVQLFINHWFMVAYQEFHKTPAPVPYVFDHLNHIDYIGVPNNPFPENSLLEIRRARFEKAE